MAIKSTIHPWAEVSFGAALREGEEVGKEREEGVWAMRGRIIKCQRGDPPCEEGEEKGERRKMGTRGAAVGQEIGD